MSRRCRRHKERRRYNVQILDNNFCSSEIWSDKLSLLHIKVTQRGGEHGGAEGTKSDRAVVYVLLIALVINK